MIQHPEKLDERKVSLNNTETLSPKTQLGINKASIIIIIITGRLWSQQHLCKPLSVNPVHPCIHRMIPQLSSEPGVSSVVQKEERTCATNSF